jgi:hypothetical protein
MIEYEDRLLCEAFQVDLVNINNLIVLVGTSTSRMSGAIRAAADYNRRFSYSN